MSITREEERRRRLSELAAKLKSNKLSTYRGILGWAGMKWGCRIERVREYLAVLEYAALIEVNEKEDEIVWVGKS